MKQYVSNLVLLWSKAICTVFFGGDTQLSMSMLAGMGRKIKIPVFVGLADLIDFLFWFDEFHCHKAALSYRPSAKSYGRLTGLAYKVFLKYQALRSKNDPIF